MANPIKLLYRTMVMFGIDPQTTIQSMRGLPAYLRDRKTIRSQSDKNKRFPFGNAYPCLRDRFAEAGDYRGHYFYQDLLVAQRIFSNRPQRHVDVGSRIDGFVAHVASFRELEVLDIRPVRGKITNVKFIQADLVSTLKPELIGYCDSLSCLHALEHFGLGRYGDPVNYDGDVLAFANLVAILDQGGKFYFSVPIGPQRIEFNAHRVFSIEYLLGLFRDKFRIDQFSYVDDQGELHENLALDTAAAQENFGCKFGCGIFELTKQ